MTDHTQFTTTKLLLIAGAILLVSLFSIGSGFMGAGGMMGGWMVLWPILLISGFAWFLFSFQNGAELPAADTAMADLRERYARGEIPEEEFVKRRETLQLPE